MMILQAGGILVGLWILLSTAGICCHSLTTDSGADDDDYADYYEATDDIEDYLYYDDGLGGTDCPRLCSCFVSKVVDCSRRSFTNISSTRSQDRKTLSGMLPEDTEILHLGYNNLTSLPRLFLESDGIHSNLQILYLQGNEIRYVHPDAFAALPNLTDLDLSNNIISKFRQKCRIMQEDLHTFFTHLTIPLSCATGRTDAVFLRSTSSNLVSLNLNSNKLKGIPSFSFWSFPKLEVLKLSWNKIAWINRRAFAGLAQLKVLQLRSNHLNAGTLSRLEVTLGFMEIHMPRTDDNQQPLISPPKFRDRRYRNAVHVSRLRELDLGDTGIASVPDIQSFSSLKRLYLDSNRITTIPQAAFQSLQRLEVLHLDGNNIGNIVGGTFASLKMLKVLDLSRNYLRVLPEYALDGLENLYSLRLYENPYLSEIHRSVFSDLWSLRLLYLQNCNLTTLHTDCWIHTMKCLWLYGNPIDCSCDTSYNLMTTFQRSSRPTANSKPLLDPFRSVSCGDDIDTWPFQSQERSTCAKPAVMAGQRILSTPENLICRRAGSGVNSFTRIRDDHDQSTPFWARIFCEKRARNQRRSQRFAQDNLRTSHHVQPVIPSDAESNNFESIFGDFTNNIETEDYQYVGGAHDDGSRISTRTDETEDSTNFQPENAEEEDEILSMMYDDLVYSGEEDITQPVGTDY